MATKARAGAKSAAPAKKKTKTTPASKKAAEKKPAPTAVKDKAAKARAKKPEAPEKVSGKVAADKPATDGPKGRGARKGAVAEAPIAAATGPRRIVFIDVENTSSEAELMRVLGELRIDLQSGSTEVTAIGNWRVVGQQLGRSLAQLGARLVHSAPAARVSDWSDLWIAVQAGIWLGRSRPGDVIDIVSHDRAFDAVGDAAAQLGVAFHRITYRAAGASAAAAAAHREDAGEGGFGRSRGGRRRRGGGRGGARAPGVSAPSTRSPAHAPMGRTPTRAPLAHAPAHAPAPRPPRPEVAHDEPHGASQEQLLQIIARLVSTDPARTVTLDALTVALKSAGFQRPPGSPRLVTRLRRVPGIEVLPNGKVRLAGPGGASAGTSDGDATGAGAEGAEPTTDPLGEAGSGRPPRRRGGRRRGGRGRSGGGAGAQGAGSPASSEPTDSGPPDAPDA